MSATNEPDSTHAANGTKRCVRASSIFLVLIPVCGIAAAAWLASVRSHGPATSTPISAPTRSAASDLAPAPRASEPTDDLDEPAGPDCTDDSAADSRRVEDPDDPSADGARSDSASLVQHSAAAPPRIAGSIRGLLVREGGPWTQDTLPKESTVMLDLAPAANPRESLRGKITARPDASGNIELAFEFPDVPEGDWELTLSALGSWRWSPIRMHVRPPLAGLVFTRYDEDPRLPLEFAVTDAQSGAPITVFQTRNVQITPSDDAGVFLQTGPLDVNEFPIDGRFSWSLWADGYAPAFGDDTAFVRRGDKRVADVGLERGWSTRMLVLVRDPQARQARGAQVLVDGHVVGVTGADGMLVVRSPREPASLRVEMPGWHSVADPLQPYAGKTAAQRGQITIVMMEK